MNLNTTYGRSQTSVKLAKDELYHEPNSYNPLLDLEHSNSVNLSRDYFGRNHTKDGNPAIFIPSRAINHILLCGITRSGKGVFAGNKAVENLKKGKGLIYIDVKGEDYNPQVILEELVRQNRSEDLLICSWPNNFGYSGINSDDSLFELYEKAITLLELKKSGEAGADYYRGVERMTLFKVLELAMNQQCDSTQLDDCCDKNNIQETQQTNNYNPNNTNPLISNPIEWYDILELLDCLKKDYEAIEICTKELAKIKPDIDLINRYSKRYFSKDTIAKLSFNKQNIESITTLHIKLFETLSNAAVYFKYSLNEALYNGKVLYIKADMLNMQSLQFLKLLFIDLAQKVRKKPSHNGCVVIADEISFYASSALSGQLATMAGFGVQYILQLQDLGQLPLELKSPVLTNCSAKLFYKISDPQTLDYVKALGGDEAVVSITTDLNSNDESIKTNTEPLLNATRIRALWFERVAVLIAEYHYTAVFTQTAPIIVSKKFEWGKYSKAVKSRKSTRKEIENVLCAEALEGEADVGAYNQVDTI